MSKELSLKYSSKGRKNKKDFSALKVYRAVLCKLMCNSIYRVFILSGCHKIRSKSLHKKFCYISYVKFYFLQNHIKKFKFQGLLQKLLLKNKIWKKQVKYLSFLSKEYEKTKL